jgi:putative ABC transport system permease protein
VGESFENRGAIMAVLGAFAALALFLSAIGIYGVLSHDVAQRTREIGIRGALGGSRIQIIRMVMRQGLAKTGAGLVVGIVAAVLLSRFMTGLLYELKPSDPWTYGAVSLLLAAVAAAASYLPARRAAKIDPIQALRME